MKDIGLIAMALVVGYLHAFEADHLAAVCNLVSNQTKESKNLKQGLFWGLGHTTTILLIGIFILFLKYTIPENIFQFMEGTVGCVLILLGLYRLKKMYFDPHRTTIDPHTHKLAFSVGLVHGMAGSGSVVALAISQTSSVTVGLVYLLIFGTGSILGMYSASYFLGQILNLKPLLRLEITKYFSLAASLICIILGTYIAYSQFVLTIN